MQEKNNSKPHCTIDIAPAYESLRQWIETLPARFEREGETIYHSRNHIKVMSAPDGTRLNVKQYHRPGGLNLLIYSWGLRRPKGRRAFTYPALLLERGIETPQPVAYIEERNGTLLGKSYFVSQQCPYRHTLYELPNLDKTASAALATAIARHTATMHERGILHRDYSPGNILWDIDEDGNYRFSLVDINRMRFGDIPPAEGLRNLSRLWSSKSDFCLMARTYAACRNFDPERAERLALRARTAFWKRYMRRHELPFALEW